MKKVLLTNFEIVQYSGSEINCITIAKRFKEKGYEVYIGALDFGQPLINEIDKQNYILINLLEDKFDFIQVEFDILWAQHSFLLDWLIFEKNVKVKRIISSSLSPKEVFECMPIYVNDINMIIANSFETKEMLEQEGAKEVSLFENYSFEEYFKNNKKIKELKNIAVVSNHIPQEEKEAINILKEKGYNVDIYGLEGTRVFITDKVLINYDLIITIGKTVQYAMSLGIPVYIYDIHGGPGYLKLDNIEKNRSKNFSGRGFNKKDENQIVKEIEEEFNMAILQREEIKKYAYDNLCFEKIFDKTLEKLEQTDELNLEELKEKYRKYHRNILISKKVTNYIIGRYNKIINYKEENIRELKEENERLYKIIQSKDEQIMQSSKNNKLYMKIRNRLKRRGK